MATARKVKSVQRPTVAMVGYGSQGRAVSQNLRDSGYPVIIGLRAGSRSCQQAKRDGHKQILTIPAAVRAARIICFAFPDHTHARVFRRSIRPYLGRNRTLWFLHATSVHFGLIAPPKTVDIILIAPHAPGRDVRTEFLGNRSLAAFYAVAQNYTGQAGWTARQLGGAIGIARANLLKTSFAREAVGDLFGEQAVLCGGLAMLIKNGFEVLMNHGWNPDHAYLEVAYQLDLIVALIKKHGVGGMLKRVSPAAQFGSLETGPEIIGTEARAGMEAALARIQSGDFARRLAGLDDRSVKEIGRALGQLTHPALERAARKFSK